MLKVLIVEDKTLFAKELQKDLERFNCEVLPIARTVKEAERLFDNHHPELAFIDIKLDNDDDGVAFARYINRKKRIPFIFLTEYFGSDHIHFKPALSTKPSNFLPKGSFLPKQLWHFVEAALENFANDLNAGNAIDNCGALIQNHIFVSLSGKQQWQKLEFENIMYIEVAKPYCKIFVDQPKSPPYFIRCSLDKLFARLPAKLFLRIHQSYCVNCTFITAIDGKDNRVTLKYGITLSLGKTYRKLIVDRFITL